MVNDGYNYVVVGLSKKATCLRGRGRGRGRSAEIKPLFKYNIYIIFVHNLTV